MKPHDRTGMGDEAKGTSAQKSSVENKTKETRMTEVKRQTG